MAVLDSLDTDYQKDEDPQRRLENQMKKFGWEEEFWKGRTNIWMRLKPQFWALFDEPYSSTFAKVFHIVFPESRISNYFVLFKIFKS